MLTETPALDSAPFCEDRQTAELMRENLVWFPAKGYGYYPVAAGIEPYDDGYFEEYQRRAATAVGKGINGFRADLVEKYWRGRVLDIGIGCGTFIEERASRGVGTDGYDVNPRGIAWLHDRGLWRDWETAESIEAVTLWDVLEHLPRPHELFDKVTEFAFVSIPIFEGPDHVLKSRHMKPLEHFWYWTRDGFTRWAAGYGFAVVEETWMESCKFGRDSVATFVLKRKDDNAC